MLPSGTDETFRAEQHLAFDGARGSSSSTSAWKTAACKSDLLALVERRAGDGQGPRPGGQGCARSTRCWPRGRVHEQSDGRFHYTPGRSARRRGLESGGIRDRRGRRGRSMARRPRTAHRRRNVDRHRDRPTTAPRGSPAPSSIPHSGEGAARAHPPSPRRGAILTTAVDHWSNAGAGSPKRGHLTSTARRSHARLPDPRRRARSRRGGAPTAPCSRDARRRLRGRTAPPPRPHRGPRRQWQHDEAAVAS